MSTLPRKRRRAKEYVLFSSERVKMGLSISVALNQTLQENMLLEPEDQIVV